MPLVWNSRVYPSGGYFFDEGALRIEGADLDDVARKLLHYRSTRGVPAGDARAEVEAFTCVRHPSGAMKLIVAPPYDQASEQELGDRVLRWLAEARSERASGVSKEEADARAEKCLRCSFQKAWSGCKNCTTTARNIAFGLRMGREAKDGEKLLGCALFGEDTRTSVWCDGLKTSTNPNAPDFCWRNLR